MFSKKGNIILSLVCTFCILLASVGGVLSAKMLTETHLGQQIILSTLDESTWHDVGMVNILLLGTDESGMRSDTMMLASLNGHTNEVNILSIPRDTRVHIGNGYYQKINALLGIGVNKVKRGDEKYKEPEEYCVEKVRLLTGLPIHHFMTVNFDGFEEIIDALGGVDFNVPFHMKYDDPVQNLHIDIPAGMQHLDGKAAHGFVRFRQGNPGYRGYAEGDLGRIKAQQEFVRALVAQKLNAETISKAKELFEIVCDNVRTDYTLQDLLQHIGAIEKISSETVNMVQLPGEPRTINGISYFLCNDAKLEELVKTKFSPTTETDKAETE
jgi:LCP family protein required for cell wall assembly